MFYTLMRNRLFLAPIGNNPQKILDVGTGFGDWAIESELIEQLHHLAAYLMLSTKTDAKLNSGRRIPGRKGDRGGFVPRAAALGTSKC